ncbi:ribonuclease H-like domain-containing protein [Candidatus Shapirobacteria bacterium]|nr:ribonuclease H-like domain-containing protein [Candidatus Shapirobacteria bacterium]
MIEVFFDIETKKIFDDIATGDPADLGISIISVFKRTLDDNLNEIDGQMMSFWEEDFPKMWPIFTNVDRIIGFNSLHFDVPAMAPLAPYDFKKLNHFDLMDPIKLSLGFRIGLGNLAAETLGHTKIDHGLNAVKYWAEHSAESLAKLKKYCEADVQVTKEVYDFGLKNKQLKFMDKWNTIRTFPVDFSYPKKVEAPQLGLF